MARCASKHELKISSLNTKLNFELAFALKVNYYHSKQGIYPLFCMNYGKTLM